MQRETKDAARFVSGWVMHPATALTLAYGGVAALWLIWIGCTLKYPSIWQEGRRSIIPTEHYIIVTASDAVLLLGLLGALLHARGAARGLRRGQAAGALIGIVLLAMIQWGAQALHRAWPQPLAAPTAIQAKIAALPTPEAQTLERLRTLLVDAVGELDERWMTDGSGTLHYRDPSQPSHEAIQGTLEITQGQAILSIHNIEASQSDYSGLPTGVEASTRGTNSGVIRVTVAEEALAPGSSTELMVKTLLASWHSFGPH